MTPGEYGWFKKMLDKLNEKAQLAQGEVFETGVEKALDSVARMNWFKRVAGWIQPWGDVPQWLLAIVLNLVSIAGKDASGNPRRALDLAIGHVLREMMDRIGKVDLTTAILESTAGILGPDFQVIVEEGDQVHWQGCGVVPRISGTKTSMKLREAQAFGARWASCCDPYRTVIKVVEPESGFREVAFDEANRLIHGCDCPSADGLPHVKDARTLTSDPANTFAPDCRALTRWIQLENAGGNFVEGITRAIFNPPPMPPEPPPAPGPRGVWERIVRSPFNPFGS